MSFHAHRNILITVSCLVHGDSSRADGSSSHGRGGHSQPPAPRVADVEAVAEGTLGGPLMSCHAQKKPQLPSSLRRASCSCGLSCPVCLAPEGFPVLSCTVLSCSCLFSSGGLLIPPDYPRDIFLGVVRVPAVGAGPRGQRPRPRRRSAMAS